MKRWTIRNVEPKAIQVVQDLANLTGTSLGEVISVVVKFGAAAARSELQGRCREEDPLAILTRVQVLQNSAAETLRKLQATGTLITNP